MKLPAALTGNSGLALFRGLRDNSRQDTYQFWSADESYAASYGDDELVMAELNAGAEILDLTEAIVDGEYSGRLLDELLPGLADALGIDTETDIPADRLWDAAGDDLSSAAALLANAGWQGWKWLEGDGSSEAYLLLV